MLASLAVALAAEGCGSTPATLDPIAQAAEATTHAGGAQMTIDVELQGTGLAAAIDLKGTGTYNLSHQEGELLFNLDGLPAAARAKLPSGPLNFTELFSGGSLYMTSPLFDGKLPNGAKWMKLDFSKVQSSLGIDPQSLSGGESNPADILKYLRGNGATVTDKGRESVRGTPTTHYGGTIDLNKEAASLPSSDRAKLRASIQKLISETGSGKLPVEVWVDDHHLLRKMTMDMSLDTLGQSASTKISFELFGFGPTPAVSAPPSNEVYDATQTALAGALPSG
jgi:hypothetical protein